jgi:heavy metal sensor kinase
MEAGATMFKSLRWRLQVWHTLILLVVVVGFGGALYAEVRRGRFDEIDGELLAAARVLEGVMRTIGPMGPAGGPRFEPPDGFDDPEIRRHPRDFGGRDRGPDEDEGRAYEEQPRRKGFGPPPPQPPPPGPNEPPGQRSMPKRGPSGDEHPFSLPRSFMDRYAESGEPPYFVVRRADGRVLRAEPVEMAEWVPVDAAVGRRYESHSRNRGEYREVTLLGPGRTTILVGRSIEHELRSLARMGWRIGLTGLAIFTAGLAGGWWLSGRAVRPIVAMSGTVSTINARELSRRIELKGMDTELSGLGALINNMLGRLEGSFEHQVRFTADASHELRTPLTVILSQVELALSRPREGAAYRESLEACGRAARRMTSLVEDLLTLARADSGKLELRVQRINLGVIADECAAMLESLAIERGVSVLVDCGQAVVEGDPERLGQVVTNLLANAIRHTGPGGDVVVNTWVDEGMVVLSVKDTGVGIAEDQLSRVFDRFYRVDSARTRGGSGGSGLGLAICRSIVEAHGGTIGVESVLGKGSCFWVRVPGVWKGVDAEV